MIIDDEDEDEDGDDYDVGGEDDVGQIPKHKKRAFMKLLTNGTISCRIQ